MLKVFFFLVLVLSGRVYAINVDLMVLYNNDFKNVNNASLAIQNYITYSNQVFLNSGMDIQFRLKHHQLLELPDNSAVSAKLRDTVAGSSVVMQLRNVHRPDIVVYLTRSSSTLCGIAFFPEGEMNPRFPDDFASTNREMAFKGVSIVGWDSPACDTSVFPHEIGHNLGGGHGPVDREVFSYFDGNITYTDRDHRGFPIASSRGHGVRDVFRTVMAYTDVYGSAPRLAYHSNPSVSHYGMPTGTSERNNASGMFKIAQKYVQAYSTCYPTVVTRSTNPRFPGDVISCGSIDRYCTAWGTPKTVMVGRVQQTVTPCLKYNFD